MRRLVLRLNDLFCDLLVHRADQVELLLDVDTQVPVSYENNQQWISCIQPVAGFAKRSYSVCLFLFCKMLVTIRAVSYGKTFPFTNWPQSQQKHRNFNIEVVLIPPGATSIYQPLDYRIIGELKSHMKSHSKYCLIVGKVFHFQMSWTPGMQYFPVVRNINMTNRRSEKKIAI